MAGDEVAGAGISEENWEKARAIVSGIVQQMDRPIDDVSREWSGEFIARALQMLAANICDHVHAHGD